MADVGLLAGLDLGTSSAKLVVFDVDGTTVARSEAAYPTRTVPGGGAEQDPQDWWDATCRAFAATGVTGRIDAIGLTGQMQDLVLVAGARAVRPALLYSDTRASAQHDRLRSGITAWEHRTGNHQDATTVAAKLAWLAEHEPDSLLAADRLLLGAPGFVGLRATGRAVCDVTTASTTGLLDVVAQHWLTDAVTAAGAHPRLLPELVGSTPGDTLVGTATSEAAAQLGVRPGTPVVHAMGDAGATTDGLVGSEPGDAYLYLGTSGWLAAVTPAGPADPGPIHSLVLPGWATRLRIGAVQSAGASAAWARDSFFPGWDFADVEAAVDHRVGDVAHRPLCLPGLAGERTPVRDGALRGAFVGMQPDTTPADLYLAVLTGVAMGLRHAADALGVRQERIALVGGGSVSHAWRRICADVFDAVVVTGDAAEPAAASAARAAADATGIAHELRPLLSPGGDVVETEPSGSHWAYADQLPLHLGLYDALTSTFHALHATHPTEKAHP